MFREETTNKIIFAFTLTLVFVLLRLGITTKFLDSLLGAGGHFTNDGGVSVLGTLILSFVFFIVALMSAIFII